MKIEVEQKFAVEDLENLRRRLSDFSPRWHPAESQRDTYYSHPARDFAITDEALRIRRTTSGAAITYKGPRLDATTKTRRELELSLAAAPNSAESFSELLCALGFAPVADVIKTRTAATVTWQGQPLEVALDVVEGVGHFVELELVVDQEQVSAAQAVVTSFATELGLSQSERRSYLELLLTLKNSREEDPTQRRKGAE